MRRDLDYMDSEIENEYKESNSIEIKNNYLESNNTEIEYNYKESNGDVNDDNVIDSNKESESFIITKLLIVANVLIWLVLEWFGSTKDVQFMLDHGAMFPPALTDFSQYWRLVTSGFLHYGFEHLLNNMFMLGCLGYYVERKTGHIRFSIIYIISIIGSSLVSFIHMEIVGSYAVSAGASGGVFGVMGALLAIVVLHKGHYRDLNTKQILFMIALSLVYGFTTTEVDNYAHLGGLVFGFLTCLITYIGKTPFRKEER